MLLPLRGLGGSLETMNQLFCRNIKKHGKILVKLPEDQYFCDEACENQYWEKAVKKVYTMQECIDGLKRLAKQKRKEMQEALPIKGIGWRDE